MHPAPGGSSSPSPGDRSGPRLGPGAEQAPARHGEPARRGAARGVKVSKSTRNYLLIVGLASEDGSMDDYDLADYAQSNIEQVLARVPGVARWKPSVPSTPCGSG